MRPKPFTVYKMKKSCYRALFVGEVKRCATECGNRFRYLPKAENYVNMECMQCGYQFLTVVSTFDERYDEDNPFSNVKDPNLLFKLREQS
jgi:hypothetical protein